MKTLLLWLCICTPILAQEIEQVTLVSAASAEIVQRQDNVLIIAKDLQPTPQYAIRLIVKDDSNKYIQVYTIVQMNGQNFASFPPKIYQPDKPGLYIIVGKPGEKLGISIPSGNSPPNYIEATIAPSTTPPIPPPPETGVARLIEVVDAEADKLDVPTRRKLADAYKLVIQSSSDKPYDELKQSVVLARQAVFGAREKPIKYDWEGWKLAVDKELTFVTDANSYLTALRAIVTGLER